MLLRWNSSSVREAIGILGELLNFDSSGPGIQQVECPDVFRVDAGVPDLEVDVLH